MYFLQLLQFFRRNLNALPVDIYPAVPSLKPTIWSRLQDLADILKVYSSNLVKWKTVNPIFFLRMCAFLFVDLGCARHKHNRVSVPLVSSYGPGSTFTVEIKRLIKQHLSRRILFLQK